MTQADNPRRVDWFAAGLGLVASVVIQLAGTAVVFEGRGSGILGPSLLRFVALLLGGALAGYLGPPSSAVWNGIITAVGFIVVAELAGTAAPVGPLSSGGLGTLGLILDDVLVLAAGTLGGLGGGRVRRLTGR